MSLRRQFTKKDLLVIGVALGLPLVAVGVVLASKQVKKYALTITATKGGTTTPAPGTYYYDSVTSVTVNQQASIGYEFNGWFLDGDLVSTEPSINVEVTGNRLLVASFVESNGSPLLPALIKPTRNSNPDDWWKTWLTWGGGQDFLQIGHDYYIADFVKFKIQDNAGNGVPKQQIAVYTEPMPDPSEYGRLLLGDRTFPSTIDYPLILISDGNGEVSVKTRYVWADSTDKRDTIGQAAKVKWNCMFTAGEQWPIFENYSPGIFCDITELVRLRHPAIGPTINPVHAYWLDNPALPVWGDAYAYSRVKLEPSHTY